ncbi:unnamed protein product [Auanema sp. JU1783]|nr:unnamed protein product [Auanema sp. JU1783]
MKWLLTCKEHLLHLFILHTILIICNPSTLTLLPVVKNACVGFVEASTPDISTFNSTFVPNDTFNQANYSINNPYSYTDSQYTSSSTTSPVHELSSSVNSFRIQDKDEILEEIVRECEAIIDRQSSLSPATLSISSLSSLESSPEPCDYKPVHRVQRKKEQNRAAAVRYRERKRKERDEQANVLGDLQTTNKGLHTKIDDITREIAVMKKLLVELGINPQKP